MMWDLIGVVLGFIAVILLLSLVVTGLVQATITMTWARYLNLKRGLTVVLHNATRKYQTKLTAEGFLKAYESEFSPDHLSKDSWIKSAFDWIASPAPTWVDKADFQRVLLRVAPNLSVQAAQEVQAGFEEIEKFMETRFATIARMIAIVWSFGVAIAFQISAPDLLSELSHDPAKREAYAAMGMRLAQDEKVAGQAVSYMPSEAIASATSGALKTVGAAHPELSGVIDPIAARNLNPEMASQALRDALLEQDNVDVEQVMDAYSDAISQRLGDDAAAAIANAQEAAGKLGTLGIAVWSKPGFYCGADAWKRWLGVLITGLLLTFGAPFWFERLKEVANLRDQFQAANSSK